MQNYILCFLYFIVYNNFIDYMQKNPGNGGCHLYGHKIILSGNIYAENILLVQNYKFITCDRFVDDLVLI